MSEAHLTLQGTQVGFLLSGRSTAEPPSPVCVKEQLQRPRWGQWLVALAGEGTGAIVSPRGTPGCSREWDAAGTRARCLGSLSCCLGNLPAAAKGRAQRPALRGVLWVSVDQVREQQKGHGHP